MSPDSRLQAEFAYANGERDTNDEELEIFEWGVRYDLVLAGPRFIGDTQLFGVPPRALLLTLQETCSA